MPGSCREIINDMKETVSKVQKATEGKERPSVYYVVGFNTGIIPPRETFISV